MATLTKTISNTLFLYGIEPHNKWGTLVWGTDVWAQRDVDWIDNKYIDNTITPTSTVGFSVSHYMQDGFSLDTIISRQFPYAISESFSMDSAIRSVYRINNGWYVSKGGITNALSFPTSTFSHVADPADNWSIVANPTTSWSQL